MGLMDILNGMQNGPRGATAPTQPGQSSGGMSPLMMALLGVLAYKALKGSGGLGNVLGGSPSAQPQAGPSGSPGGLGDILGGLLGGSRDQQMPPSGNTGGLGDILGGLLGGASPGGRQTGGLGDILGGLLGGPNAGNALNTGLHNLVGDLEDNGHGDVVKSWVSAGANKPIAPTDLANALGADTLDQLSTQTGMPRDQLLSELSQKLPHLVDQLTPNGRLPTEQEAARW